MLKVLSRVTGAIAGVFAFGVIVVIGNEIYWARRGYDGMPSLGGTCPPEM